MGSWSGGLMPSGGPVVMESADVLFPKETVINTTQLRALLPTVRVYGRMVLLQAAHVWWLIKSNRLVLL